MGPAVQRRQGWRRAAGIVAVVVATLLSATAGRETADATSGTTAKVSASSKAGVEWLRQNAHPIRTLDLSSEDLRDLAFLKTSVAGARVVMLGEQSHGDGTTFLAKGRLIRFLHEEMGFDVLAFESGLYDVETAWAQIKSGSTPEQAMDKSVFSIWTTSAQVAPLIGYIAKQAKTDRPLAVTGFDSQFTGTISSERFLKDLDAFVGGIGLSMSGPDRSMLRPIISGRIASHLGRGAATPSAQDQRLFDSQMDALVRDVRKKSKTADVNAQFWIQVLTSVQNQARMDWNIDPTNFDKTPPAIQGIRDAQMAANLLWLIRTRYPDRKIIVWAASSHIIRNRSTLKWVDPSPPIPINYPPMGDIVHKSLGNTAFSVAFAAAFGEVQLANMPSDGPWKIGPPPAGTFEDIADKAGLMNAWVDLRAQPSTSWAASKFTAAPLGYALLNGRWKDTFDAIVFTRDMVPSKAK